jgi:hypothetical protein
MLSSIQIHKKYGKAQWNAIGLAFAIRKSCSVDDE